MNCWKVFSIVTIYHLHKHTHATQIGLASSDNIFGFGSRRFRSARAFTSCDRNASVFVRVKESWKQERPGFTSMLHWKWKCRIQIQRTSCANIPLCNFFCQSSPIPKHISMHKNIFFILIFSFKKLISFQFVIITNTHWRKIWCDLPHSHHSKMCVYKSCYAIPTNLVFSIYAFRIYSVQCVCTGGFCSRTLYNLFVAQVKVIASPEINTFTTEYSWRYNVLTHAQLDIYSRYIIWIIE